MPRRTNYKLDLIEIEPGLSRLATWTFAGAGMSGTEQSYRVVDGNFPRRNEWEFIVRLPKKRTERIEVRPRTTPNVQAWAELPDRSLTFMRGTLGAAKGKRYCQIALADATHNKTKDIVRADERDRLPRWFAPLASRIRRKQSVRPTKGTDGDALVLLVGPDDYAAMIRAFFACKVWVLKERFTLDAPSRRR